MKSEFFGGGHNNLRYFLGLFDYRHIGYSKKTPTGKQYGVRTGHPLKEPHVDSCSKRTSATPSLLIYRCRSQESHSLALATELRWLTDKSKPQWSENCQVRGIINIEASFDGQVLVACICCSPAQQFSGLAIGEVQTFS